MQVTTSATDRFYDQVRSFVGSNARINPVKGSIPTMFAIHPQWSQPLFCFRDEKAERFAIISFTQWMSGQKAELASIFLLNNLNFKAFISQCNNGLEVNDLFSPYTGYTEPMNIRVDLTFPNKDVSKAPIVIGELIYDYVALGKVKSFDYYPYKLQAFMSQYFNRS